MDKSKVPRFLAHPAVVRRAALLHRINMLV